MGMSMSGRERVLAVLRHGIPDRVPVYEVLIDPPMVEAMIGIAGKNTAQLEPRELVDLYCRIGLDCVIASLKFFRPTAFVAAAGGQPDLASIPRPTDAERDAWLERCARVAEIAHQEGLAAAAYDHGAFDVVYESLGFENFMYLVYDDFEYVDAYTQLLFDFHLDNAKRAVRTGIDYLLVGDDISFGSGLFIPPDPFLALWRERERELVGVAKAAGMPVEFHTDGRLDVVLPYLIDIGVDLVNPVEPYCNDIVDLKARFGDRIGFRGNVDIGGNLSSGTPDSVYEETRRLLERMKPGGNFVCSSSHSITKSVVPENYLALVRAVKEHGGYDR
jgi:uroporphyrinogen decarboxylase